MQAAFKAKACIALVSAASLTAESLCNSIADAGGSNPVAALTDFLRFITDKLTSDLAGASTSEDHFRLRRS